MISFLSVDKVVITKILLGWLCDVDGDDLPEGSPPPPPTERAKDDYYPYQSRADFGLADFLFRKDQMSGKKASELMDIWAADQQNRGEDLDCPFSSAKDLYDTIDATEVGDVPWQAFSVQFNGEIPPDDIPT